MKIEVVLAQEKIVQAISDHLEKAGVPGEVDEIWIDSSGTGNVCVYDATLRVKLNVKKPKQEWPTNPNLGMYRS